MGVTINVVEMLKISRMDASTIHADDAMLWYSNLNMVGILLFGQYKSAKYSFGARNHNQVKEGARTFMAGCSWTCAEPQFSAIPEGFERYIKGVHPMLYPLACYAICLIDTETLANYINNVCGNVRSAVVQGFESYDYDRFHSRCMAESGYDAFVQLNNPAIVASVYAADTGCCNTCWEKWEDAASRATQAVNARPYIVSIVCINIVFEPQLLARALKMCQDLS